MGSQVVVKRAPFEPQLLMVVLHDGDNRTAFVNKNLSDEQVITALQGAEGTDTKDRTCAVERTEGAAGQDSAPSVG